MKKINLTTGLLLCILPLAAWGQTAVSSPAVVDPARQTGDREFTLGGGGAANTDFDNTFGGVNFSYGAYFNPTLMWSIRQSINYSNPDVGGTQWNGATRFAIDQHLTAHGALRPFFGANIGRVYGDAVRDTWTAGLEAGAKFYVQPRTFVYFIAEYGWFFRRARGIDNAFNDGQINWGLGLGFNF